jgi:hypothetical protein
VTNLMKQSHETVGVFITQKGLCMLRRIRFAMGISLALVLAGPAFAQYGTGSTGSSTGGSSPSYGSGKAIGIGVGAAAAGAGVLYLTLHHGNSVTGCVQSGNDGLSLVDEKSKRSYSLLPGGADLLPGERVALRGKKSQGGPAGQSFQPKKIVKNLGSCAVSPPSPTALLHSASIQSSHDSPQ